MVNLRLASLKPCPNGVRWILEAFGECVETPAQLASFWIGLLSLLLWFFPLFPQLYSNYKRANCEGLSIYFLLFWFVGDLFNLVGTLLTEQLPTQVFVAAYYILQDATILCQFAYYSVKNQWHNQLIRDLGPTTLRCVMVSTVGQSVTVLSFFHGATDQLGYSLGVASAMSYLSGRVPQLYFNYKKKNTEGMSMAMIYLVYAANLTYGISVLLGGVGAEYLLRHLPWLMGSFGCCATDTLLIYQHFHYKHYSVAEDRVNVLHSSVSSLSE